MDIQEIKKTTAHYDFYDYSTFWSGRHYENSSDNIAVTKLLRKIKRHKRIIDVGGGLGRLVPCYIKSYQEAILIDPSSVQLKKTQEYLGEKYKNLSFIQGTAEHLPLPDESVDTILCVRVSHHIPKISVAIEEYRRVLVPQGYLVLEIANKLHLKARIRAFLNNTSKELNSDIPISIKVNGVSDSIPFVNHNPKVISALLQEKGFEIIAIRSVSNFRWAPFKKFVPPAVLLFLESTLQAPLGRIWFGPSIYFLARKKRE